MATSFQTLSEAFEDACRRNAEATAFREPNGAAVTFSNYFFTVLAMAERLQDRGVRAGQLVSVGLGDAFAGTALRLALLRLGAIGIAVPRGRKPEGVRINWWLVGPGSPRGDDAVIEVDGSWVRSPRRVVPVAGTGALIKSSSGTTGLPKHRLASDRVLLAAHLRRGSHRSGIDGPTYVGYAASSSPGFGNVMRVLLAGKELVVADETPDKTLVAMARAGVTLAFVPPYAFNRLLATGGPFPPSLRRIVVGGGEITPQRAIEAERALNCEVWNSYGSSETGSIAHHRPALTPEERGVVGHPYADIELRFVGEDGRDRKAEAGGELMLRPPMHTRALDFPSLQPLGDMDGWISTGDIAHLRPDGLLVLDGRKAELLNVGGNKHAPAHFEDLARGFAGIRDLAAFWVVAPEGGDHVGLAIVPDKGFDVAAFGALLGQRLGARYPFHVMAVPELPFTEAGKIDRRLLAASFAAATARTSPDAATQVEVTGSRPG